MPKRDLTQIFSFPRKKGKKPTQDNTAGEMTSKDVRQVYRELMDRGSLNEQDPIGSLPTHGMPPRVRRQFEENAVRKARPGKSKDSGTE